MSFHAFLFYRNEYIIVKNLTPILESLQDSSFKGAAIFDEESLKVQNFERQEKLKFEITEQKIFSYNFGIVSNAYTYLNPIYLKKIWQLVEGGFFKLWFDREHNYRSLAKEVEEDKKVVLTINHLGVGFLIIFVLLTISMVIFFGEMLVARIMKRFA